MDKIKGVLIDVGKTIITNTAFNFVDGLQAVYNEAINKNVCSFERYLEVATYLENNVKEASFSLHQKSNQELLLAKYLDYLNKETKLLFALSLDEQEDLFLIASTVEDVIPGVIDFLKYLDEEGIVVYALSNSRFSGRAILKQLTVFGVNKYLKGLMSSADICVRKPSKEIFFEGIKAIQLFGDFKIDDLAYLGNDYNIDMLGSSKIGLKPIWYNEMRKPDINNVCFLIGHDYYDLLDKFKTS